MRHEARPARAGVVTLAEAAALVDRLRARGLRIAFTNGVFDLVHPGHLRYLRKARAEADALVVGVNSDRSVRAGKGAARPVVPAAERAELLASFDMVDAVVIFDEDTPAAIIAALQPDVLVKGADWAEDAIVGRETVATRGGRVVRTAVEAGYSTSAIIERIKAVKKKNGDPDTR